ncbi:MAG: hypothetical protein Q8S84_08095 [bacterium]|nr:hypothetical protein [bacterium]MDP3381397.1 hypothetical protein [bacterium]
MKDFFFYFFISLSISFISNGGTHSQITCLIKLSLHQSGNSIFSGNHVNIKSSFNVKTLASL